ncbi:hypothetical protein I4U23_011836 [Adineta vaga]|nr:hypothetical protein I4U23_011836 [Adineta vaga]
MSFDKTDIDQATDQLQTFIKWMKFDEQHMKQLEELINGVQILAYKLLIMSGAEINDEAMQLVRDVIDEFSKAAELTQNQAI